MPSDTRALFTRWSGWSGALTFTSGVNSVVVTPPPITSALSVWEQAYRAVQLSPFFAPVSWEVTRLGRLQMVFGSSVTVTFSGDLWRRLGFPVTGQSGVTLIGTGRPQRSFAPGEGGVEYTLRVPTARERDGELANGAGVWMTTPSTAPNRPAVNLLLSAADTVQIADAWAALTYPGVIDLYRHPQQIDSYRAGAMRASLLGWSNHYRVSVEVTG